MQSDGSTTLFWYFGIIIIVISWQLLEHVDPVLNSWKSLLGTIKGTADNALFLSSSTA